MYYMCSTTGHVTFELISQNIIKPLENHLFYAIKKILHYYYFVMFMNTF